LFFTPQSGLWLGATPETLLTEKGDTINTMALAGTRPVSGKGKTAGPWPDKEAKEQKFVTDFILQELDKLDIKKIKTTSPYTSIAGIVEHIRTDIEIDNSAKDISLGKVINALHPTPAICGMPRQNALEIISHTEQYPRTYYTGYLGPVNVDLQTKLMVNLRCMKAHKKGFTIFAGGGITNESDAELEWEETEMKASVMKSVIEKE
jgi:isochorismate synthase